MLIKIFSACMGSVSCCYALFVFIFLSSPDPPATQPRGQNVPVFSMCLLPRESRLLSNLRVTPKQSIMHQMTFWFFTLWEERWKKRLSFYSFPLLYIIIIFIIIPLSSHSLPFCARTGLPAGIGIMTWSNGLLLIGNSSKMERRQKD